MRLLGQSWRVGAGCHAEGRGFESLHPLLESPAQAGFFVASRVASTRPNSGFVPNGSLDRRPAGADQTAAPDASSPSRRPSSASEPLELHVLDARLAEGSRLRGYVP